MKLGIGSWILLWAAFGCQQKISHKTEPLALQQVEQLATDTGQIALDSSIVDSLGKPLSWFEVTSPYRELFAPSTAYETPITVYTVHLDTATITLLNGRYRSLATVNKQYPKAYLMLTNGGMFHPKGDPVGLFLSDSGQVQGVNTTTGYGNFFLQPNGVFYLTKSGQAGVLETQVFLDSIYNKETPLQLATQSGPMLVINGQYHPKFRAESTNKYIRSGVGVTDSQEVVFILSDRVVNLHTFARMFIEKGCRNALYLDGAISSMYIRDRADDVNQFRTNYGPIIGVYAKTDTVVPTPLLIDSAARSRPVVDSIPIVRAAILSGTPLLDSLPPASPSDSLSPPNLSNDATN